MCLTSFDEEKYRATLLEEGREEGADLLFSAIMRLKDGETAEDLAVSGIPKSIIEKALLVK